MEGPGGKANWSICQLLSLYKEECRPVSHYLDYLTGTLSFSEVIPTHLKMVNQ